MQDWVSFGLLVAIGVGISALIVLFFMVIKQNFSPKSGEIFLNKEEWVVTKSHIESYTDLIQIGDALMPVSGTREVPDRFDRR